MSKFVLLANDFSAKIQIYASEEDSFTRKMKKKNYGLIFSIWHFQQWLNFSLQVAIDSLWLRASHIQEVDYYYIYTFPFPNNNSRIFFCQITTAPICPFRFHEKSWIFFFILNINCGKSSILFFCHCIRKIDSHPLGNNKHNITYCM